MISTRLHVAVFVVIAIGGVARADDEIPHGVVLHNGTLDSDPTRALPPASANRTDTNPTESPPSATRAEAVSVISLNGWIVTDPTRVLSPPVAILTETVITVSLPSASLTETAVVRSPPSAIRADAVSTV